MGTRQSTLDRDILQHIEDGNVAGVRRWLEAGKDNAADGQYFNKYDPNGLINLRTDDPTSLTPLMHIAARNRSGSVDQQAGILQLLIDSGGDPELEFHGVWPLHAAVDAINVTTTRCLLDAGVNCNRRKAVMADTEPPQIWDNSTPLTALIKIWDRDPKAADELRNLLISRGAKTSAEIDSGTRLWLNRRRSIIAIDEREVDRIQHMGKLLTLYVKRNQNTDILPENSKVLLRYSRLIAACSELGESFDENPGDVQTLTSKLEVVRNFGAPPNEIIEQLKSSLRDDETLFFREIDDSGEELPPIEPFEPMPMLVLPRLGDVTFDACNASEASERLIKFAQAEVLPATCDAITALMKLRESCATANFDKGSARTTLKALHFSSRASKSILKPLVIAGGISIVADTIRVADDHKCRLYGVPLFMNLINVDLPTNAIAVRAAGFLTMSEVIEKELDAEEHEDSTLITSILSHAIGAVMLMLRSDNFTYCIDRSVGARLYTAVLAAKESSFQDSLLETFSLSVLDKLVSAGCLLQGPARSEGDDYTDGREAAESFNRKVLAALMGDDSNPISSEEAKKITQHLHKHYNNEHVVENGLRGCNLILSKKSYDAMKAVLIEAGLLRAAVRILKHFASHSVIKSSCLQLSLQAIIALTSGSPELKLAALQPDNSLLLAMLEAMNKAIAPCELAEAEVQQNLILIPTLELISSFFEDENTIPFEYLVSPKLAEDIRHGVYTALTSSPDCKPIRIMGTQIVRVIYNLYTTWGQPPWVLTEEEASMLREKNIQESKSAGDRLADIHDRVAESLRESDEGEGRNFPETLDDQGALNKGDEEYLGSNGSNEVHEFDLSDKFHDVASQYELAPHLLNSQWIQVEGIGVGKVLRFQKISRVHLVGAASKHHIDFSRFWNGKKTTELNMRNVQGKEVLLRRLKGKKYNMGRRFRILNTKDLERMQKSMVPPSAIDNSDAQALYEVAHTYLSSGDHETAIPYWLKAAGLGHAKAQYDLAECYRNGQGVAKDLNTARTWYEKAANQTHAKAQYALGKMYRHGEGVKKNYVVAIEWWTKASHGGVHESNLGLAFLYMRGKGAQLDLGAAATFFEAAAEGGLAEAQYQIGKMYEVGRGVRKDFSKARQWYQRAADQGHNQAIAIVESFSSSWHSNHARKRMTKKLGLWWRQTSQKNINTSPFREFSEDEEDGTDRTIEYGVGNEGQDQEGEGITAAENRSVSVPKDAEAIENQSISVVEHEEAMQELTTKMLLLQNEKRAAEETARNTEKVGNNSSLNLSGGDGKADSEYTDWLTTRMLKTDSKVDNDDLLWEYRVFKKEIENAYLYAQEQELKAQKAYGHVMTEKDTFEKLIRLLQNNPAIAALRDVSTARDDVLDGKSVMQSSVVLGIDGNENPSSEHISGHVSHVKLKDDPQFKKYFTMLAMHIPLQAIKQKMTNDGIEPSILDRSPDEPSPNGDAISKGAISLPATVPDTDILAQIRGTKENKKNSKSAKSVPMESALKEVEKALNGRRGAKEELSRMLYPTGDVRFEVCVRSLAKVLDSYHEGGASSARTCALDLLEKISASEIEYKKELRKKNNKADLLDKDIEKWERRKEAAPEREQIEKAINIKWALENKKKNEACLNLMRSYIPSNIRVLDDDAIIASAEKEGKHYPRDLSERLRSKKMLHWLVAHPEDISNSNFLAGADRNEFINLQEYDIIELRAIFCVLPESFNLDPSGKKKLWRCKFIDNLKYLVINDDAGNLEGLEQKRGRAYFFKTRPIFDAEKIVYKTRADMLVAAENTLKDISKDAQEIKQKYEDALAAWRESSDKTRKEELKAKKNALKVIFDEQKIRVSDLKLKLSLSSKKCAFDKICLEALIAEENRIEQAQSYGKLVTPAFTSVPKLLKMECVKKLSDAEEIAARTEEIRVATKAHPKNSAHLKESQPGGSSAAPVLAQPSAPSKAFQEKRASVGIVLQQQISRMASLRSSSKDEDFSGTSPHEALRPQRPDSG